MKALTFKGYVCSQSCTPPPSRFCQSVEKWSKMYFNSSLHSWCKLTFHISAEDCPLQKNNSRNNSIAHSFKHRLQFTFYVLCGCMNKMSVFSQWQRWGWRDIAEASCFLWRSMRSRTNIHCALPMASVVTETAQAFMLLIGSWSVWPKVLIT